MLGLVRDVADHARLGAGAEQGALRAFEDLDALEVGCVDVKVTARHLHGLVIEIETDGRPLAHRAAALQHGCADAETADGEVAVGRALGGDLHVRQELHELVDRVDLEVFERLCGQGLHRDRDVLDVFTTTLRRDHDLIQREDGLRLCDGLLCLRRRDGGEDRCGNLSIQDVSLWQHSVYPLLWLSIPGPRAPQIHIWRNTVTRRISHC